MASIKVSYQNTFRRFLVPKSITWSELESNLRTLFLLPPTFSFALSYTDEDGDVITLSSDLELQDIFSQVQQSTTLRFSLIPYNKQQEDNESNNEQVVDQLSQPSLQYFPVSQQLTRADDELSSIQTPSSVKGKQKAEISIDNSDPSILDEQCNEEQTRAPFIDLATQFQKVIDKLRPMIEQQPQLIEQANSIMDQILRNIPVDVERWTHWFNDKIAEAQRNFYNAINKEDDGEKQMSSAQQQYEEPFFNPQNVINNNSIQHVNQAVASTPRIYDLQNRQPVNDETKEKLGALRSMGFYDDNRNNELLKIHKGNVERVVEILVEDSEYSVVDDEVQMVEI